jgi:hypothetical protein
MGLPRLAILVLPVGLGTSLLGGGCAVPVALTVVSYGADGVSLMGTDKTLTDHAISAVTKKDCALWRIIRGRKICNDRPDGSPDPYEPNYSEPFREQSEGGGVSYGPPLHAQAGAPASSWDAAAYKTSPGPAGVANGGPLTPGEVREVQSRLKAFGFDPGLADGIAGPQTAAAVRRYQAARAVAPTGNTDRPMLDRLRGDKSTIVPR